MPTRASARLALALAAACVATPLAAVVLPSPPIPVAVPSDVDPYAPPRIATAGDGSYLVVWSAGSRVAVRAFDAADLPLGPVRVISPQNNLHPAALPQVAAMPGGGYLVVWSEAGDARIDDPVVARVLDPLGQPLGAPQTIASMDEYTSWPGGPALAVDAGGVVTLAWSRHRRILVQRFVVQGGVLVPTAAAFDAGPGTYPNVAVVPGGIVVAALTWEQLTPTTASVIFARQFAADGTPRGVESAVTTSSYDDPPQDFLATRLVADPAGRTVLVWYQRSIYYSEVFDRIRAQPLAADGTPIGDPVDLVVGAPWPEATEGYPPQLVLGDAAARADGSFLVTWSRGEWTFICGGVGPPWPYTPYPVQPSCGTHELDGDVLARVFAADGTPLGPAFGLATDPAATELGGGAAARNGGWIVAHHGDQLAVSPLRDEGCDEGAGDRTLCLAGRFRVDVEWQAAGAGGGGRPLAIAKDTGGFWFFSPENLELAVKVVDGTAVNNRHWVFFASLTDVAFELTVTDMLTGEQRRYENAQGTMASRADTDAFPGGVFDGPLAAPAPASGAPASRAPNEPGQTTGALSPCGGPVWCVTPLPLLDGRFLARVEWRVDDGLYGYGNPHPFSRDTGLFSFFSPQNQEVALKVLDGRGVNGHFWVFFASLTDVEFDLVVVDSVTGEERTYHSPAGTMASRADVEAF
jgi:hypothetical protein